MASLACFQMCPLHWHSITCLSPDVCTCIRTASLACLQMCPLALAWHHLPAPTCALCTGTSSSPCLQMCPLPWYSIISLSPDVPSLSPALPPAPAAIHHLTDTPVPLGTHAGSPPHRALSHLPLAPALCHTDQHQLCHLSLPPCATLGSRSCHVLGATTTLYPASAQGNISATTCTPSRGSGSN